MGKWSLLFLSYYTSFTWILILDLLHDNFTITPVEISSKQGDNSCVNLLNLNMLPQRRQVNPLAWNLMAQDSLICWVIVFNLSHLLWATLALLLTFDPLLMYQILFGATHSTPFIYIFIFSHKDICELPQLAYSSANRGGQRKKQEVIQ